MLCRSCSGSARTSLSLGSPSSPAGGREASVAQPARQPRDRNLLLPARGDDAVPRLDEQRIDRQHLGRRRPCRWRPAPRRLAAASRSPAAAPAAAVRLASANSRSYQAIATSVRISARDISASASKRRASRSPRSWRAARLALETYSCMTPMRRMVMKSRSSDQASGPLTGRLSIPARSTGSGNWLAERRHLARAARGGVVGGHAGRPRFREPQASASVSGVWDQAGAETTASAAKSALHRARTPNWKDIAHPRDKWQPSAGREAPAGRDCSGGQILRRLLEANTGGAVAGAMVFVRNTRTSVSETDQDREEL